MRAPKVDYALLRQEYVTGDISLRELAKKHDMSWSAVAQKARVQDSTGMNWNDHRAAYRRSVNEKSIEKVRDRMAGEDADIREELVNVNRATLAVYIQQLKDGEVKVAPKDAVSATLALLNLLGEPTSRTESTIVDLTGTGRFDPADLRRLVEVARSRIVEGTVVSPDESGAKGTRPN